MKTIIIEAGEHTPGVVIDCGKALFNISGISAPENPAEFFRNINVPIDSFLNEYKGVKTFSFDLVYFNSSSAKFIYQILKKLKNYSEIKVKWYYEMDDTDLLESGKDFQQLTGLDFEFIAKN